MNMPIAKEGIALELPQALNYSAVEPNGFRAAEEARAAARRSFRARVRSLLAWVAELPRRHAVLAELDALSDRELADIGLARADLPHLFDASFATARQGLRVSRA